MLQKVRRMRRGFAIPLVVIFCGLMTFMVYYMTRTRLEAKRQNVTQFNALQAHYLAQGAIQHALLKFRVLPTEAYAATALARGLCPFHVAPPGSTPATGAGKTPDALTTFVEDCNFDAVPLQITGPEFAGWHCEIGSSEAITSFTSGTETVNVVEIEAVGIVPQFVKNPITGEWKSNQYTDKVGKTVQVRRSR
ncbi:MAG: hypothetical protein HY303_00960 [Candidatus Wallbacteria bacterium]|nr:hypothetical protein [Candidatus Wallbacteria bacterium]